MTKQIYKVGGVILNKDRELLVVRKEYQDRVDFIIPGGRQEVGETDEQTLRRELREELGVGVSSFEFFGRYEETAIFENVPLIMSVYQVAIIGIPSSQSEIKECVWIDRNYSNEGYELGTVLSNHVIPKLIKNGHM